MGANDEELARKQELLLRAARAIAQLYQPGLVELAYRDRKLGPALRAVEKELDERFWELPYKEARLLLVRWYRLWERASQEAKVERIVKTFRGRRIHASTRDREGAHP